MAGEHLDLTSDPFAADTPAPQGRTLRTDATSNAADGRRYVGITFTCCDIYARVYINRTETAYEGRCPRCCRPISLKIGPGGVDARFFTAF